MSKFSTWSRQSGHFIKMDSAVTVDYSQVTEVFGHKLTQEQLARMCTRYYFAGEFCEGKDVLEVACGVGQGLGYLASKARHIVGGDCTEKLIQMAENYYQGRVETKVLDAHQLPFANKSFDAILLYEAIYYLRDPDQFLRECRRVLKGNGTVIICTANKDWKGFCPSPLSVRYFSAHELSALLKSHGFDVQMLGDCPVSNGGLSSKVVSAIRKMTIALHLMPKTMRGKEKLKKIFFGKLVELSGEIVEGMMPYVKPTPISHDQPNRDFKVLFAVGRLVDI